MTKPCKECKYCMGYESQFDAYMCTFIGFVPGEIAIDEKLPCDLYEPNIRDDTAN